MKKTSKLSKIQKGQQKGGLAVFKKYGSAHFAKIAKRRWAEWRKRNKK